MDHCGSVACPRKRQVRRYLHRLTHRFREQARSHRLRVCSQPLWQPRLLWERGLPAKASAPSISSLPDPSLSRASSLPQVTCRSQPFGTPPITVGAWLAREGVGTFNIFID
ncbi:hypothetical protein DBR18_16870 [Pseudomonas sp. HMWF021]|nr:hypothetical protein DBR18_16870 [Pseudomonas sp. HMWF021]